VRSLPQGRFLCSVPVATYGGVCADSTQVRDALLAAARTLGERLGVRFIELRSIRPTRADLPTKTIFATAMLKLDADPDLVWRHRVCGKARTHVRRARKGGVTVVRGHQWIPAFHRIYQQNMRRLGTPAFNLSFVRAVAESFGGDLEGYCAVWRGRVIGGLVTLDFKDTVWMPWASSLRQYSKLSPNNLLYWTAIEQACRRGYHWFDFGRSLKESGPLRFKLQWGAVERGLHYQYLVGSETQVPHFDLSNPKAVALTHAWRRLPFTVTRWFGHWALTQVA